MQEWVVFSLLLNITILNDCFDIVETLSWVFKLSAFELFELVKFFYKKIIPEH